MTDPDKQTQASESLVHRFAQHVFLICREVAQEIRENFCSDLVKSVEPIHPDFRIMWRPVADIVWHQNYEWSLGHPPMKVGFYFNDPSLLDDCPWVAKIARNVDSTKPQYRFFGLAFGDPNLHQENFGLEQVKKWAMRFPEVRLMTYGGVTKAILKSSNEHQPTQNP